MDGGGGIDGGGGGDTLAYVLAVEELSRVDPSIGVLVDVQNTLVINALLRWGSEAQQSQYLPQLASRAVEAFRKQFGNVELVAGNVATGAATERRGKRAEEYIASGRSALYNKVAGICITGSEDGALHTMGTIMMVLTWMGFTLPPECACYWVGEVGYPPAGDTEKRRKNPAVPHMAMNMARNLVYYAQLLREHAEALRGATEDRLDCGPAVRDLRALDGAADLLAQVAVANEALEASARRDLVAFAGLYVLATAIVGVLLMKESKRIGRRLFPAMPRLATGGTYDERAP